MDNKKPHAQSSLDFTTTSPVSLAPPLQTAPDRTVMIWDDQESRRQRICHTVESCGIAPLWLRSFAALEQMSCSRASPLAAVALSGCPAPGDRSLEAIRSLKQKGFTVISYEDGAQSWPVGARCRALLAGASCILDSATPSFVRELRDILEEHAQAEAIQRSEEKGIQQTMRQLGMVGGSQAMMGVFQQVLKISALSDLPTLITGETGTGKELLAHAIHRLDRKRCNGPFVALNCGAINAGLAESELFGYRRGAFTGADRDRRGLIRAADGGVLFLDEIGELDEALQVKLLRVLQERRVLGLGDDHEVGVNVRVIAATNRDLEAMVEQKQFRADLLHRLRVLSIHIPPLRERRSDLQLLIEYLLQKNQPLTPTHSPTVSRAFVEALMQLELPGNVRQLENLLQSALVNRNGDTPLDLQHFPPEVWQQLAKQSEDQVTSSAPYSSRSEESPPSPERTRALLASHLVRLLKAEGWTLMEALRYCECMLVEGALHLNHGNQSQTARLLGVTPRSIYSMIRRHRLST